MYIAIASSLLQKETMDDEKLVKANNLQKKIETISSKLDAFMDIGTHQGPDTVVIEGRGNYRANDVLPKSTLRTINLIVISELEEILKNLEVEYENL